MTRVLANLDARMAGSPVYTLLLISGIVLSAWLWMKTYQKDSRLFVIYLGALLGAFAGAKLGFLLGEGWVYLNHPDRWLIWASGKTILGALAGGYAGVEGMKKLLGYRKATGDWFAAVIPLTIALGRIGCLFQGCCQGRVCDSSAWYAVPGADGLARWPVVPMEIVFQLVALVCFTLLRRRNLLIGQHFHLYLMGYGVFRFGMEFLRETPRLLGPLSGYAVLSLLVALGGTIGFVRRYRSGRAMADPRVSSDVSLAAQEERKER